MRLYAPCLFKKKDMTIDGLTDLQTLNECTMECTRQSRWKEGTQRYLSDMLVRNVGLMDEIRGGRYTVSPTTDFTISERGHIRKIEAPSVRDRVIAKSLMKNVLIPSLRPYMIYDNYASLSHRGTDFARRRFVMMLRKYIAKHGTDGYILFFDFEKYFENIDHETLKRLVAPRIASEPQEVRDLVNYIIDTSSKTEKGLNLVSECPQILAVYYPTPIDTYIKVVRSMPYYGRYMDDGFVPDESKDELTSLLSGIEEESGNLRIRINKEKTRIIRMNQPFTYLQVRYTILPSGRILTRPSRDKVSRERRRLRSFRRLCDDGRMTEREAYDCYRSWRGSVIRDHNACHNVIRSMDALFGSLFPSVPDVVRPMRSGLMTEVDRIMDTEDIQYCLTFN